MKIIEWEVWYEGVQGWETASWDGVTSWSNEKDAESVMRHYNKNFRVRLLTVETSELAEWAVGAFLEVTGKE